MEEKKNSTGKKIILSIFSGLLFGIFAAISFYAVREVEQVIGIYNPNQAVMSQNNYKDDVRENIDKSSLVSKDEINDDSYANKMHVLDEDKTTYSVVTDVTEVVADKMPSIVSIINNYTATYFYYSEKQQASGSGIIIGSNDDELLIVTNYHVIDGNDSLEVIFCDDSQITAQVKGTDSKMDLAVIAVNLSDINSSTLDKIVYATIGDSDKIKVGEPVIAIGNALGYGQSVTTGVVSAINREIAGSDTSGKFIQTDAAINPGNSGGALMNLKGDVIGINSNKIGGSTVEGMGYAIPISAAKPIIEELMMKETKVAVSVAKQSYLGISGATITQEEADFYGYPSGVYVASVYEESAAEKAGIKKGDFIYSFDGEVVTSMEQLKRLLSYYEGGTEVEVVIMRYDGDEYKEKTLSVTLGYKNKLDES